MILIAFWRVLSGMIPRRALPLLAACLLSGCSPVAAFNVLAPMDPAERLGHDVAYGDNPRQTMDIYGPRGVVGAHRPIMVFFYGGGWSDGRKSDYAFAGKALAAQGYLTVVADYRIYPEVRYPAFLEDNAKAVAWIASHADQYGGDPTRIALSGHSAGAYNAVMLGLEPRYLRDAGADPKAIKAVVGLSGPYDFLPFQVNSTINTFGQAADPGATQPINHVRRDAPPIFIGQGLDDTVVGPKNAESLAAALKAKGVPYELHLYEGVNHSETAMALSRLFRGRAPVLAEMTAFLNRYMGVG